MKKKILFLIHDLSHGGAEKVLVNLVNNMDQKKFDITVQTLFDVGVHKDSLKEGITYKTCFKHMIRGNSHLMKLFSPKFWYKRLIKDDYDIVVSYLEGPPARVIAGCDNPNTKKVNWLHIELNDKKAVAKGFRNYKEAVKCYKSFDQIISVSNTVRETFEKSTNDTTWNIKTLYNTNETEMIRDLATEDVEDVEFEANTFNICSVGKITKTKGYDRLAVVHKKLLEKGLKHKIYILGIGEQKEEIEAYLRKNGLENSFVFLGFNKNPYKYVQKCDLFICSSLKEGFSTAVTEALIVGTPVVSTLCSGAKELLGENNEYGIVVENSKEGIYKGLKQALLWNDEEHQKMKKLAEQRGSFFSRAKTVAAVEEMLEKL